VLKGHVASVSVSDVSSGYCKSRSDVAISIHICYKCMLPSVSSVFSDVCYKCICLDVTYVSDI
jgi:hypothetical protein